jgi:hypothetical protein
VTASRDADALRWDDICHRIADLWPGRAVRVVRSTCGGVGDVILDGDSATAHERAAMRRALPDVRFPRWPALSLTLRGELACGAQPGATTQALERATRARRWPAVPCVLSVVDGVAVAIPLPRRAS